MKTLLIIISFLFISNSSVIHKDRLLEIDKNGNIIGLPKKFSPAKFDLVSKKLRLHKKEVVFPKCLTSYFEEQENSTILLFASWYHSKNIMPYYLNFTIVSKEVDYGYSVLIDLETLELIEINKKFMKGDTFYSPKINITEECHTEYKNKINTLN